MKFHIGTSGWNYDSFVGVLYPPGTAKRRYLEEYARHFHTVELNASFYRSFPEKTWIGWRDRTPEGFVWAVKAPRFITHIRRLDADRESLDRFFARAGLLAEKLGVVLWQLPPSLAFDMELVQGFLARLPGDIRHALEARHASWHRQEVFDLLKAHEIAWVVSDTAGRYPVSVTSTADFSYVRLHGHEQLYRGEYGTKRLRRWLEAVRALPVQEVFWYFDNTDDGSAPKDALLLKEMLGSG